MNRKDREYQDKVICEIIGGEYNNSISIEEGYFRRERDENLKEQGWPINPVPELTGSDIERRIFQSYKDMERLEEERVCPMASPDKERREEAKRERGWPQGDDENYGELMTPQKEIIRHN